MLDRGTTPSIHAPQSHFKLDSLLKDTPKQQGNKTNPAQSLHRAMKPSLLNTMADGTKHLDKSRTINGYGINTKTPFNSLNTLTQPEHQRVTTP